MSIPAPLRLGRDRAKNVLYISVLQAYGINVGSFGSVAGTKPLAELTRA